MGDSKAEPLCFAKTKPASIASFESYVCEPAAIILTPVFYGIILPITRAYTSMIFAVIPYGLEIRQLSPFLL